MTSQEIQAEAERLVGKGILAAAIFLKNRFQEVLSVPAPRVSVIGRRGKMSGVRYYRATSPATPGAPPRKLSGTLRRGQTYEISSDGKEARIGTNIVYAARHEYGTHPYMVPTLQQYLGELSRIIDTEAR